jgi:hypothetical protein
LSFIGPREISERVSENIHFDFLADKNYTSEGGGTQMKGRFRGGTPATRGIVHSAPAKDAGAPVGNIQLRSELENGKQKFGKLSQKQVPTPERETPQAGVILGVRSETLHPRKGELQEHYRAD